MKENEFIKTIVALLTMALIFALFTWKPIDVAWKVYDKYEDLELAFYASIITLVAYIVFVLLILGIVNFIIYIYEYISKKVNKCN